MNYVIKSLLTSLSLFFLLSLTSAQQAEALRTVHPIFVDGDPSEPGWDLATWYPIDQVVLGVNLSPEDFSGRFKALWDTSFLYLLVEVVDDSLSDDYPNPLEHWWDDDCVEIFIDEDNGRVNHQYNHDAFAYHVSIEGDVVDLGVDQGPILLNDHVQSAIQEDEGTYLWEMRVAVYGDDFDEFTDFNLPVVLEEEKVIGFSLGYCDNDETISREHFIVSNPGQGDNGWVNSNSFGTLTLKSTVLPIANSVGTEGVKVFPLPCEEALTIELDEPRLLHLRTVEGRLLREIQGVSGSQSVVVPTGPRPLLLIDPLSPKRSWLIP